MGHGLRAGEAFSFTSKAKELLEDARKNRDTYSLAKAAVGVSREDLLNRLDAVGFRRSLTEEQIRNVCLLAALPSGATFSVPGAGKTTEALATFSYRASPSERLLVVAPKNAFAAWDEQLGKCFPQIGEGFTRLRSTASIPRQLLDHPRFMIIGYQQLTRVREEISDQVARNDVHVFLDESHRIKGIESISTEAVLGLSHLAKGKLILSGTPMPQSRADLVPQLRFLYPELAINEDNAVEIIKPVYVRTTKAELNLPDVTRIVRRMPMDMLQRRVYDLMKSEIAREAEQALSVRSKQSFRRLGRSVARALQFTSNPELLAKEISFVHSNELAAALAEGRGPKFRYLIRRVRELVGQNKKVLVWTTFVENVETISVVLQDLGCLYIHGGVDAGDELDQDTREGKIKLFHDDPNTMVLVANPAAASEGISLHTVCHHAIYLDRNFNAAQYLQSEDRIHRLGLDPNVETTIEILECEASVDEAVRHRLGFKISQMASALNDPGIVISAVLSTPEDDDEVFGSGGLDVGDVEALLGMLRTSR